VPLAPAAGANALSGLWARERISALMDQLRGGAAEQEIRAAVLGLALEHQLVSRYTSLVAVDKTPARSAEARLKSASLATNLPEGWVYEGVFGELPRGAAGLRFDLLIGALLLLLAALLWRRA
jgi:Ca-activated chloride channel family protein